jgi:hypothetical protein
VLGFFASSLILAGAFLSQPWPSFLRWYLIPLVVAVLGGMLFKRRSAMLVYSICLNLLFVLMCGGGFVVMQMNYSQSPATRPDPKQIVPIWLAVGTAIIWGAYVVRMSRDLVRPGGDQGQ